MVLAKRCVFLLLVLVSFLVVRVGLKDSTAGPDIYLEGRKMAPEARAIQAGTVTYVNLALLRQAFNISTIWRQAAQRLYFKKGAVEYTFYAGSEEYNVSGKKRQRRKLKAPLLEKEGSLWIPLEFLLEQGLALKRQNSEKIEFAWQNNYLLGVENSLYQGRPAFEIIGTQKINITKYRLKSRPLRVVCEIDGIMPSPGMANVFSSEHPWIRQVRWKRQGNRRLELVFDLVQQTGIQLIPGEGVSNMVRLVPDYQVTDVVVRQTGKNTKVLIKTTSPAQYDVKSDPTGHRMEIWFSGARNAANSKKVTLKRSWLRKIKINQVRPHQVKAVLDRLPGAELYVARSSTDPNWVEISTVPKIVAVNWVKTATGGDLTIAADGVIPEIKEESAAGPKWRIDLNCLRVAPGLTGNIAVDGPLVALAVSTPEKRRVRIEARCRRLAGYHREVSPDRRTVVYHFHRAILAGKTIVLDPGHGGADESAGGKQGTREKDLNLEMALRLKELLELAGATVICTRYDDTFIGLYERAHIANANRADLFVSIHANYHGDPEICGVEVYHFPERQGSQMVAKSIIGNLVKATGLQKHGVIANDFVVIRETRMPGILVELGYLSNYREEGIMRTAEFKEQAALGMFQGISAFFN